MRINRIARTFTHLWQTLPNTSGEFSNFRPYLDATFVSPSGVQLAKWVADHVPDLRQLDVIY